MKFFLLVLSDFHCPVIGLCDISLKNMGLGRSTQCHCQVEIGWKSSAFWRSIRRFSRTLGPVIGGIPKQYSDPTILA
ncbi:hypothetical protein BKA65DRAFT_234023 [Rhexocercosporidium sp. MPI-PUGE-AT-0058]|nr:hypothetical protein BKA65DRAFT_234023 [Rhexocercosporidium sp. MPI-PUGE-AT-0058]